MLHNLSFWFTESEDCVVNCECECLTEFVCYREIEVDKTVKYHKKAKIVKVYKKELKCWCEVLMWSVDVKCCGKMWSVVYEKIEIETAGGCNKSWKTLITLLDFWPLISPPKLQLHNIHLIAIKTSITYLFHTASKIRHVQFFAASFPPQKASPSISNSTNINLVL